VVSKMVSFDVEKRTAKCSGLLKKYYKDVPLTDVVFDAEISGHIAGKAVLEGGCGDMAVLDRHARAASLAVGLDLEIPNTCKRRSRRCRAVRGDLAIAPFREGTFDVIILRSVCEHLRDPVTAFAEMKRVLRPGGVIVLSTPNKYDYGSMIARATPQKFHEYFLTTVFGGDAYDTFPTYYRANTTRTLRTIASRVGLRVTSLKGIRHYPYYLMVSPLLFRLGVVYDRLITALGLTFLQPSLVAVLQKPPIRITESRH
jgi:SAM-dependent methyltransferase